MQRRPVVSRWELRPRVALNAKLKKSQSDESQRLPITATYIIGSDGVIVWRQFDPDYKNRSSVNEILANLPEQN